MNNDTAVKESRKIPVELIPDDNPFTLIHLRPVYAAQQTYEEVL